MIGNWINTIRLTIIGMCLLLPTLVHANITVSASVDKQTLTINDTLEYKLTIAGSSTDLAIEENFLSGFYIVRRSSAQSYQLINGEFSASHIKTFVLRPKKEGRITIPPALADMRAENGSTNAGTPAARTRAVAAKTFATLYFALLWNCIAKSSSIPCISSG